MATKSGFTESFFDCPDGGSLYFRSYGNPNNQPVLCMHGLTRNANDFHQLAQFLQESFYVISVDQRGRARSSYLKDPMAYSPETYLTDMTNLIGHLGLKKVYTILERSKSINDAIVNGEKYLIEIGSEIIIDI